MKTLTCRFFALLFLVCLSWAAAYAGCPKCPKPTKFIECDKTYIDPEQIEINENQIQVNCEGKVYLTSAIYTDERGVYFKDFRQGGCPDGFWECSVCHDCNENYYIWCRTCYN